MLLTLWILFAVLTRSSLTSAYSVTYIMLLYRSSLHGRGLNRFWSNVEGYQGPLLVLISAASQCTREDNTTEKRKWTIGALTQQGFENGDLFYGNSGHLYALSPVFHAYSSIGM